jgi:hypothetical protein
MQTDCDAKVAHLLTGLQDVSDSKKEYNDMISTRTSDAQSTLHSLSDSLHEKQDEIKTRELVAKQIESTILATHDLKVTGHASMKNSIQYASVTSSPLSPAITQLTIRKECILVDDDK